jgi:TATA-box binding protein (TBP) (component of TFIID and TFIIIB)
MNLKLIIKKYKSEQMPSLVLRGSKEIIYILFFKNEKFVCANCWWWKCC